MNYPLTDNSDNSQLNDQRLSNSKLVRQKVIIISIGFCMGYVVAFGVNYFFQDQMALDVRDDQNINKNQKGQSEQKNQKDQKTQQLSCSEGKTNFFIPVTKMNYPFHFFHKQKEKEEAGDVSNKKTFMDLFIYIKNTSQSKVFVLSQDTPVQQLSKNTLEVCIPSHLVPRAIWSLQNGSIFMTRATGVKFPSHQMSLNLDSAPKENIQIFKRNEEW